MSEQSRGRTDAKRCGGALRTGGRKSVKNLHYISRAIEKKPEVEKVRTEKFVLVPIDESCWKVS